MSTAGEPEVGPWRGVHPGWRPVFAAFLVLTLLATIVLYVLSRDTADLFAWTVVPAISAAFLGGGYASGFVLVAGTARERWWAGARIGVVTIFCFVVLTLAVTIGHRDRFHFDRSGVAGVAAWFWLAVYLVVTVAMAAMFVVQHRVPGTDPPVRRRLPTPLVTLLVVQALVLGVVGALLLVTPDLLAGGWPWPLTRLTGRAVGAWCLPLGIAAALAVREADVVRLRAAALTYTCLALLHGIALVRFHDDVAWARRGTWAYVVVLASMGVAGVWGWLLARGAAEPPVGTSGVMDLPSAGAPAPADRGGST